VYRLWRGMIPAITHSLPLSSIDSTKTCRHSPKSITTDSNLNRRPKPLPLLTEPFKGRPPITLMRRTDSQRRALQRKIRYLHRQYPKSTPKPRYARLRMWYKDARKRRRQLKEKAEITRQVDAAGFESSERVLVLFRLFTTLHNPTAVKPTLTPTLQPHSQTQMS